MDVQFRIDGSRRRAQRLGDDLATVESTPRILRPVTDECVRTMWNEGEEFARVHQTLPYAPKALNPFPWFSPNKKLG